MAHYPNDIRVMHWTKWLEQMVEEHLEMSLPDGGHEDKECREAHRAAARAILDFLENRDPND